MSSTSLLILMLAHISQISTTPQFISFKDGKLGVDIAGFHAGLGIGGLLDGSGTSGGLYAEAGTPFGQTAKAGLGGSVDDKGGVSGRLYAGATGRGNLQVSAGLAGSVNNDKTAGEGFASAQAGDRIAFTKMVGETSVHTLPESVHIDTNGFQVAEAKPLHEKVEANNNVDSTNEVKPLGFNSHNTNVQTIVEEKSGFKAPADEQVYVEQQPQVVEKRIIHMHNKPRRHNYRKTAFLGGYIGPEGEVVPPSIEKSQTVSHKRIDVVAEETANAEIEANSDVRQTKLVTYQRNPTFFQDIFNIPISTLKAVGALLGNTAANTNVSVQKSASVQAADTDSISVKRDPSSVSSSSAHISVETPSASKLIDDIFAIPINTLSAVNKFLENNVAGRKTVQVRREGGEPTRIKLGPHARRRANKQVVIVQEGIKTDAEA